MAVTGTGTENPIELFVLVLALIWLLSSDKDDKPDDKNKRNRR
jgi:hypothetical protein